MIDVLERARRYVAQMDPAVSGSGGHDATFKVACVLVHGFDLGESAAYEVLAGDFNPRCNPMWSEREMRHKISSAMRANHQGSPGHLLKGRFSEKGGEYRAPVQGAKRAEVVSKRQEVDGDLKAKYLRANGFTGMVDLMERSPVDVRTLDTPEAFLSALYREGERVLVFTSQMSQGDYGHFAAGFGNEVGKSYRLGARPGVKAEVGEIPRTGREGVWFLAQPVDGEWRANGAKDKRTGEPRLSRRSGANVLAWRYMLLEADDVVPDEWLAMISQLPLAVAAVYTSGGRSLHALVRVDAANHKQFYSLSQKMGPLIAKLGGDSAAISGVRLTRLPMCYREGKVNKQGKYEQYAEPALQRLLYFNPNPEIRALVTMPKVRVYNLPDHG